MNQRNGLRYVILLSLLILTLGVSDGLAQADDADARARELQCQAASQVRETLRAPDAGVFDVGTRQKFDELRGEKQERATELGYTTGDEVWIAWRDCEETIVDRERAGEGPLAEIVRLEASLKVPAGGGTPELTLIPLVEARLEDLNDEVQALAREKGYKEGEEVRFRTDSRASHITVLASPRLAEAREPAASAPGAATPAAPAAPQAKPAGLAMKVKFEKLSPANQTKARTLGYKEGDTVPCRFDLATSEFHVLPRTGTPAGTADAVAAPPKAPADPAEGVGGGIKTTKSDGHVVVTFGAQGTPAATESCYSLFEGSGWNADALTVMRTYHRGIRGTFSVRLWRALGDGISTACGEFQDLPKRVQKAAERAGYKPGEGVWFFFSERGSEIIPRAKFRKFP